VSRSRYDELHDHYQTILTTKSGTRYERLAAVVFAALDSNNVVIHDLKVVGEDTGVKHQIDVYIEQDGRARRVLVECKDYDVRGEPVGLGAIRDFWGVVGDIHPDEAWVISCNHFTKEARKYAKGKGIKLATLRAFADSDWRNRVHTIITTVVFQCFHNDRIDARFRTVRDEDAAAFFEDLGAAQQQLALGPDADPSQIYDGTSVRSITEIVTQLAKTPIANPSQSQAVEGKMCDGWVSGNGKTRYQITGFSIGVPITQRAFEITIKADQATAKLLLLDEKGLHFVLWDTALEAYTVDETGQLHLAPDAVQKRLATTISPIPVPGAPS
jgi:hypothetical protein